jgi:NAD dependent epimerase/dehydratase family
MVADASIRKTRNDETIPGVLSTSFHVAIDGENARIFPDRRSAMDDRKHRIFVTGHRGMVGSALVRRLQSAGYDRLVLATRDQLDLLDQAAVQAFLARERPDYIFIAAAKVGGIQANNTLRAEFIYQNLMIAANLIDGAHRADVQRLMFLGSSCVYPRDCAQPIREEALHRRARSHQRALCHRQDRRHQAGRGLQPPVRPAVRQRDADQPVRPQRQLRPRQQPRPAGLDPQDARSQVTRRRRAHRLGHRHAAARVPLRR